ncbi:hypothetical protein DYB32_001057 [Aphanomyces invadans]|uniref:Armadillo repeat-containing domain-containing protein n=1 Tax=Aphanomyces invadans TaxID=157072 RepID=A0A418B7W0_9STRA|nr:hypothetical protein DYB32_001057 [Aphanomyces invadans]
MAECTHPSTPLKAKEQCLAHLANFSYDPINFAYFQRLNVVDMFVDFIDEVLSVAVQVQPPSNKRSTHYLHAVTVARLATQGICNVAPDPRFQKILVENDAIPLILQATHAPDQTTSSAALSTLYFLLDSPSNLVPAASVRYNEDILTRVKQCSLHDDTVIRNVAVAFLAYRDELESDCKK